MDILMRQTKKYRTCGIKAEITINIKYGEYNNIGSLKVIRATF